MYTILDCQNVPTLGFAVLLTQIFDDVHTSGFAKCTYFWILKMYLLLYFQNAPTSGVHNSGLQYTSIVGYPITEWLKKSPIMLIFWFDCDFKSSVCDWCDWLLWFDCQSNHPTNSKMGEWLVIVETINHQSNQKWHWSLYVTVLPDL